MHQIGLRSKQKERKQNTDKSGSKEESKHKRNVGNSLFNVLRRLERLLQVWDEVVCHLEQRNSNVMFFFALAFIAGFLSAYLVEGFFSQEGS